MRQLLAQGWMHNRARLITASFLTKDLHIDWREGERHFMRHLLCGDEAQNNGNWQWITSIGVDPAPYFRRMYNPMTQQMRHDPDGRYVRRWCPELAQVPLEHLAAPWEMSDAEQEAAGCVIGRDYPAPIVDHKAERERAMERYRAVSG
jgi:deoxyribodipyrimidine photo-lyase